MTSSERKSGLPTDFAAAMTVASPHAFVTAAERADQFATAAIDVAQLQVFADDVYQRLMAVGTGDGEHHEKSRV